MGVSSIYPYPPHLNLFGVWNLLKFNDFFSSSKKHLNKWKKVVKSIKCKSAWENVFKGERRERWNDTIGRSLVPNGTAGSQRRACPIAWGRRNVPKPDTKPPKASRREKGERVTSTKVVVSSSGLQASHAKHGVHMIIVANANHTYFKLY